MEQSAFGPKAVSLVAVDLVEGFADIHAAAFQLDVYEGQAVDQDGDVVAVGVGGTAFGFVDLVLVDHLQVVVVDVFLVQQADVFGAAVVTHQGLDVVFLDADGLFFDAVIGAGDVVIEKPGPFCIAELHIVEALELGAQVGQ